LKKSKKNKHKKKALKSKSKKDEDFQEHTVELDGAAVEEAVIKPS